MNNRIRGAVGISAALTLAGTALAASPLVTSASAAPQTQGDIVAALRLDKDVSKSATGSYMVLLKADPLLGTFDRDQLDTAAARSAQEDIVDEHDEILSDANVSESTVTQDLSVAVNAFSVSVDHAAAVRLAADPKVAAVLPDELLRIQPENSIAKSSLRVERERTHRRGHTQLPRSGDKGGRKPTKPKPGYRPPSGSKVPTEEDFLGLTGRGEAYDEGIDGSGVLVGIIDTGIWPEHPSFADDGSFPAAPALAGDSCQFGNTEANPDDTAFTCNNKLVGARDMTATYRSQVGADPDEFVSARDDEGHGTHTASTTAGDRGVKAYIGGRYIDTTTGIAPRSQVIAYKALGNQGGFTSDLASAIDQAVADGVDVINYSIGGGANLLRGDSISFLFANDAGVFSAVSAGNSGPGPATVGGPSDSPWVTSVAATTETRFYQGTARLGDGTVVEGASVTPTLRSRRLVDARALGNPKCLVTTPFTGSVDNAIVLCERGENGRVEKSQAVSEADGAGMIMMNIDTPEVDNLFTDNFWVPTLHVDEAVGERVRTYLRKARSRATASITETAEIVKAPWKAPSVTIFSSRGESPTAASIIKPDIAAPGIQVLAGGSPFTDVGSPSGELFQAIAGTSMSSPQIAGVYALIKQAQPDWTASQAKSAIQTTASLAVTDNSRVTAADPFDRGAGAVNPGDVDKPGLFNPGLVYDAGFNEYLGFMCDAAPGVFADPTATCTSLENAGVPTRTEDLNLATIGIGTLVGDETVTRTVTNVSSRPITVRADTRRAPRGYSITVSPSRLTVPAGGSASFDVTIANTGDAPAGEWRFGNLTWRGSGYTVNSAVAVRASQIGAEAMVSGSGASGSVEIPVKFGYDGTYAAVSSGLVGSAPLTGTVQQDPDQTYPSADDGAGVTRVPVTIDDVGYWRMSLVQDTDDDIDLYLLGPDGSQVASSTSGGTDELIELSDPAPGEYTLVVHGWQVNGTNAFSIDNWVVPNGPGSLTVTSAPTTATTSGTGTVGLSWTGASPAGEYYGLVKHTDGTDTLAETVVSVTGAD